MPDDQGGESSTGSQVGSWAWAWANRNAIFDTLKQIYQWFRGSSTAEQPQPDAPGILIWVLEERAKPRWGGCWWRGITTTY